ncbi:MAG TPA: glycoside hydrolase family 30 beta sandwich domain-containing protein [Chryseosolibacter sp.]
MNRNRKMKSNSLTLLITLTLLVFGGACVDNAMEIRQNMSVRYEEDGITASGLVTSPGVVNQYVTYGDKSALFQNLSATPAFTSGSNRNPNVDVQVTSAQQTIDGFGYTLTQGSAYVMMTSLTTSQRTALLTELFHPTNGIGTSFIRIGIGATDLSTSVYTYNDLTSGTDVTMSKFSLNGPDLDYLVPVLKEIVASVPSIKIIATPWTAPAWMKINNALSNGSLKPEYYDAYALYFVKYLQAMQSHGITIHAVTPQNEPEHCCNNPAMLMTSTEQTNFILKLAPALTNAGFATKIIAYDHNCDNTQYPIDVLNGPAGQYVDGAAFHLYAGNISALSTVHNATSKNVYFTEQYTGSSGSFLGDLGWHMQNVMIGGTNNWAKVALEWNLANDPTYGPHTNGGCTTCLGAVTVGSGTVTRNVSYYIVAHMSKFVRPGALHVSTTSGASSLFVSGFINDTANGNAKVLVAYNNSQRDQAFNIRYNGQIAPIVLKKKSVGTYVWY